jgi:hypothetical protein
VADIGRTGNSVTDIAAAVFAALFVVVLAISAYWDPRIRVLHVFEAIPYIVSGGLCVRRRPFGYALGAASGAFWLWIAGFHTTFVRNGFERMSMLIRTGTIDRLDQLIAAPAAIATGGLVVFSLLGYVRLPAKSRRDAVVWAAAVAVVPAFFWIIFVAFAPQYLPILYRAFGS